MSDPNDAKAKAEARFKKAEARAEDASEGKAAYDAEAVRVEDNTARLRAQRLEKEAADRAAPAPVKRKRAPIRKPKA